MTLTLITVNYNGAEATLRLLRSLERQTSAAFDIIIVDNNSFAEDRALLGAYAASSPLNIDVIYAPTNTGFSGGNNLGIRKALSQGADWMLLINNDTTVGSDFIATLCAALPDQDAVIGLPVDEGDRIVRRGIIEWLSPTLRHATDVADGTGYAIGAAVAVHANVFRRIGLLDERYFLYFEDAEFSCRASRAGVPLRFIDGPVVAHAVSHSTSSLGAPVLLRYHFRNVVRFTRQHAPLWPRVALPFWLAWQSTKQLLKIVMGRDRAASIAILAGIRDGILDRGGNVIRRKLIAVECRSLEYEAWGVARQIRGFLEHFVRMPEVRHTYDIVAYFNARIPDEPWLREPHVRAVLVRPFRWLPPSFTLYFYLFFPIRVWFDRPDVTLISNYMLPLLFIGRSVVMLTEDIWHEMYGTGLPFKYRAAYRIFSTWAAQHATRIMAISHASKVRVAELFGIEPDRIVVNELAVPAPQQLTPRTGSYLLYVAQGLPRRHLRETILAFRAVAARHPALELIAVGPDKYQPPIVAQLVAETNALLGRSAVTWTERVTDAELASLYTGARTLVYVSDMEAFGLPPVEMLSYGLPSILMDSPVHREIFGSHAFFVQEPTVAAIAAAMERSLTDETHREAIRQAAQSIVARYTWDAHARRMLDIIRSIT